MDAPDAEAVRGWSKVDFDSLGYADDTDLQVLVDRASAMYVQITGRPMDSTMPVEFAPLAEQATQRMTEILAFQAQQDYAETLSDFQLLSNFSAGPYSETRRSLTEIRGAPMLVGDPGLNAALFASMTPERYEFWYGWLTGNNPPAFEITEVDWGNYSGYPELGIDPLTGVPMYGGPWG